MACTPMKAPPAKDAAKSQPLRLRDGTDEKKAPTVHPIANPAPYPIMTPPPKA